MKKVLQSFFAPTLGLVLALLAGTTILVCLGESSSVLWEALYNVCFTDFGLGYTLFYTTPYLFTGLAVAICFRCGLFNIGGEGQLYLGAISVVVVATALPGLPSIVAVPLGIATAFLAGGLWGGLAGWLKARRGSHEVIVTILLNFLAIALVNYLLLYPYDNPHGQNPETLEIGESYRIPTLHTLSSWIGMPVFESTPANVSLFLALLMAVACHFFLFHTSRGFELRAVGQNADASRFAGIRVSTQTITALFLGGGLAGLVGVNEVMGYHYKVVEGFSPQYGFTGIAVALLARSSPLGIILSAFLFGILQNSARELEFLSERVTKELATVIQGILIAFVAAQYYWERIYLHLKKRFQSRRQPA
ncbi:ABC transporter permease [bacterium]|nr:ABC transporter permease [bacterium]